MRILPILCVYETTQWKGESGSAHAEHMREVCYYSDGVISLFRPPSFCGSDGYWKRINKREAAELVRSWRRARKLLIETVEPDGSAREA